MGEFMYRTCIPIGACLGQERILCSVHVPNIKRTLQEQDNPFPNRMASGEPSKMALGESIFIYLFNLFYVSNSACSSQERVLCKICVPNGKWTP